MKLKELNQLLHKKIESVILHIFNGAGRTIGQRFQVGDINGTPGNSFVVYLKDGRFEDFATSDKGDLVELFTLKYRDKKVAIDAIYMFLGIPRNVSKKKDAEEIVVAEWKKPVRDWSGLTENPKVLSYLSENRRLSPSVLEEAKVRGRDDKTYVFLTYTHDPDPVCCGAVYVDLDRVKNEKTGKIKKVIVQSKSPLSTLFGHTTCPKDIRNGGRTFVIITEGQVDCLSLRTQGIKNSVSMPFGVSNKKWVEQSWDWLMDFDEIYLLFDNDEEGQKAVEEVAKKIGFDKCRKCILPKEYNDPNEAHQKDYDLHKCIKNTKEFKPERIVSAGELAADAITRMSLGRREDQGIPFMGWVEKESLLFNVRPREMTLYTGYPGHGKSTILYQFVAYIIFVMKHKVIVASLEEEAEDILGLIMIHALAIPFDKSDKNVVKAFEEVGRQLTEKLFFYYYRGRAPYLDVLKGAEFVIRKHGAQHFILDSVAKTDLNIEDNKEVNDFLGHVTTSMNDSGAHYHIVAHPKKSDDDGDYKSMPDFQSIKGAASFGIETFNCITMFRNKAKEYMRQAAKNNVTGGFTSKKGVSYTSAEIDEKGDTTLYISKQKVGGAVGKFDLFYDPLIYSFSRTNKRDRKPYAKEIYENFIEAPEESDNSDDSRGEGKSPF